MNNIIDLETVKSKRSKTEEEKAQKLIDQVHTAKTAITMILGKLDVGYLEGTIAMQMLVNKIIEGSEWDEETFNKYVTAIIAINNDKELH